VKGGFVHERRGSPNEQRGRHIGQQWFDGLLAVLRKVVFYFDRQGFVATRMGTTGWFPLCFAGAVAGTMHIVRLGVLIGVLIGLKGMNVKLVVAEMMFAAGMGDVYGIANQQHKHCQQQHAPTRKKRISKSSTHISIHWTTQKYGINCRQPCFFGFFKRIWLHL
jgi:hypothetical protein